MLKSIQLGKGDDNDKDDDNKDDDDNGDEEENKDEEKERTDKVDYKSLSKKECPSPNYVINS